MLNHLRDAERPQSNAQVTVAVTKAQGIALNRGSLHVAAIRFNDT
jgi:hypothetical protein